MGAERTEIDILSLHPARRNHLPPASLTLTPGLVPFHPTVPSLGNLPPRPFARTPLRCSILYYPFTASSRHPHVGT